MHSSHLFLLFYLNVATRKFEIMSVVGIVFPLDKTTLEKKVPRGPWGWLAPGLPRPGLFSCLFFLEPAQPSSILFSFWLTLARVVWMICNQRVLTNKPTEPKFPRGVCADNSGAVPENPSKAPNGLCSPLEMITWTTSFLSQDLSPASVLWDLQLWPQELDLDYEVLLVRRAAGVPKEPGTSWGCPQELDSITSAWSLE